MRNTRFHSCQERILLLLPLVRSLALKPLQLLNRAVVAQLPSGDPGADLMAQPPREARSAAPRYTPQYTPQGSAAQQASAPSSLDVLLSRNGLLQSEQGGLPQS